MGVGVEVEVGSSSINMPNYLNHKMTKTEAKIECYRDCILIQL